MTIGEKIKECRKIAGISQKALGEKLNISQQQVAQYEKGKRIPKYNTLIKLVNALNISFTEFINDTNYQLSLSNDVENHLIYINTELDDDETSSLYVDGIWIHDKKMLYEFHKLNTYGKCEAIRRVEELTQLPKYTKDEELPF